MYYRHVTVYRGACLHFCQLKQYFKSCLFCFQNYQLTVGDDFFENTLAMNKMLIQKQFGTLRQQVNKDK